MNDTVTVDDEKDVLLNNVVESSVIIEEAEIDIVSHSDEFSVVESENETIVVSPVNQTEVITVGIQGPAGAIGPVGPQGIPGPTGNTGPQGIQGEVGPIGPQGIPGTAGASTPYTNLTPVPTTIGGITSGTTFNDIPVSAVLDQLLYPYQTPAFTAFSISGQSTTLEVGQTIAAGNKTFTWSTSNSANINSNSIIINDVTGSVTLGSSLTNDGTEVLSVGSITKNSATGNTFRISAVNSKSATFTRDFTVNWQWRMYWGISANSSLTEAQIKALANTPLASNSSGGYSMPATEYKYICYPTAFGLKSTFKDPSTNLDVAMLAPTTVSVTNSYGVTTNYYVHRTLNKLGGTITINVS